MGKFRKFLHALFFVLATGSLSMLFTRPALGLAESLAWSATLGILAGVCAFWFAKCFPLPFSRRKAREKRRKQGLVRLCAMEEEQAILALFAALGEEPPLCVHGGAIWGNAFCALLVTPPEERATAAQVYEAARRAPDRFDKKLLLAPGGLSDNAKAAARQAGFVFPEQAVFVPALEKLGMAEKEAPAKPRRGKWGALLAARAPRCFFSAWGFCAAYVLTGRFALCLCALFLGACAAVGAYWHLPRPSWQGFAQQIQGKQA